MRCGQDHCRSALRQGSVAALPESIRADGPKGYAALGLGHHIGLHEEFVIPNASSLKRSFALVETHLSSLSERTYAAAHPTALDDRDPNPGSSPDDSRR